MDTAIVQIVQYNIHLITACVDPFKSKNPTGDDLEEGAHGRPPNFFFL